MTNEIQPSYGRYELKWFDKILVAGANKIGSNWNWFCFKTAIGLRKLVTFKRNHIIDAEVMGMKLRLYPHENLADRFILFTPKLYDTEEFEFLSKILKPDSVFVDIGANVGFYSLWAARSINSDGRIIAIEPNPKTFQILTENIRLNNKPDYIETLQTGVADKDGEFVLKITPRNLGGATIIEEVDSNESVKIKCSPLVSILAQQGVKKIDVIKIDTEGADEMILGSFFAQAQTSLYPGTVIVETGCSDILSEAGYSLAKTTKADNRIYQRI